VTVGKDLPREEDIVPSLSLWPHQVDFDGGFPSAVPAGSFWFDSPRPLPPPLRIEEQQGCPRRFSEPKGSFLLSKGYGRADLSPWKPP